MKRKLLFTIVALLCSVGVWAETDYTSLMSSDWTGSTGNFGGGKERYQGANYQTGKIMYQSFTAPAAGIYEIKFYAVTSCTADRYSGSLYGDNIAQAYATAGSNKTTVAMTVINQTGCTLVADANIRTLSVEAAEGETIEYGLENIATGGNWYTIKELSAKMKTVAEIFQAQYDEAYAIWEHSTENETGAKATFKTYVDAMNTALTGTLAEAQIASDNLAAALVTYESKSYPVKGSGVKYDFTSKMNMAINAWTCVQGNGPAQYGFTGATETYKGSVMNNGDVMHQTITDLANGEYEIHFYAVANSPRNESTYGGDKAIVYANNQEVNVEVYAQDGCTPSDYEHTLTVMVSDGSITYGIKCNGGGNWYVCKNVALYMTGAPDLSDYYDAISANLTTANGLKSSPMKATVLTATGDDNLLSPEEKDDLEYRKQQLERLKEDVVDLEEMNSGVSIMDLGLNEFRLDLLEYMQTNHDVEHTPFGLHAVVRGNAQTPAGTIFVLKNRTAGVNIDHKNQLHPFYMVYICDDGEVQVDHLHPKELLDKMRLICKQVSKPDVELCHAFNKETRDGLRMGKYSDLLSKAINSIISVKEQSDVDSFLEGFAGELFEEHYVGLDDFELICFLVIKN